MTSPADQEARPRFVGLNPWLPWPLSAWRWWTVPVRAERLAVIRMGLALVLLVDLLVNYRPYIEDFFVTGGLGDPEIVGWYGNSPRLWWSIFRGFHDPLLSFLALIGVLVFAGYLGLDLWGRLQNPAGANDRRRRLWPIVFFVTAGLVLVLGVWGRDVADFNKAAGDHKAALALNPPEQKADAALLKDAPPWESTGMTWAVPLILFLACWLFWVLESLRWYLRPDEAGDRWWWALTAAWSIFFLLFVFGLIQRSLWLDSDLAEPVWQPQLWQDFLLSWQKHPVLMRVAFWVWVGGVALLFLGWQTRGFAILVWVLSTSFANLNSNVDNAGDTVRGIILFYLMLSPCGAAFAIDAWLRRRRGPAGPVYISPWPLRLLFIQMVFIYWCNGLYKIMSKDWRAGDSFYLMLSDVTLTRFSHVHLDLPHWLTKLMTWTVLIWELTFPLLVCNRWTRPPALIMGALFHLGIFVTMELGGFAPYMWTLYLPFLPWERWIGPKYRPPIS